MPDIHDYINSKPAIADELLKLFSASSSIVIVDAGSCEGEDSIRYSRLFPNAKIFAFEPHPGNLEKMAKNLREFPSPNVRVIPKALASRSGKMELHVSSGRPNGVPVNEDWDYGNKSHSLLAPDKVGDFYPWLQFRNKIEVEVTTLGRFIQEEKLQGIDFLHADIQGAEKMMLDGLGSFIHKTKCIWIEASRVPLYKDQVLQDELIGYLTAKGFTLSKNTVGKVDGDLLFVRNPAAGRERTGIASRLLHKVQRSVFHRNENVHESFSQCGEDLIIRFLFDALHIQTPSFIDIGAYHPSRLNNTFLFYRLGSRGINVEPNPSAAELFSLKRPEDLLLSIGVSDEDGVLDFYEQDSPTLSTFSKEEADRNEKEFGIKTKGIRKVKVKTLPGIITEHCDGCFPDLLSLDVEGLDQLIVFSMRKLETLPVVICAETTSFKQNGFGVKNEQLIQQITDLGYRIYADTFVNTIFLKNEFWL